jgi:hypothetical protein
MDRKSATPRAMANNIDAIGDKRDVCRFRARTVLVVLCILLLALVAIIAPAMGPRVRHRWAVETLRRHSAWTMFDDPQAIAESQRTGNYHVWHQAQGNWWLDVLTVQFGTDDELEGAAAALPNLIGLKQIEFGRYVTAAGIERLFAEAPPLSLEGVAFYGSSGSDRALVALKRAAHLEYIFSNTGHFTDAGLVALGEIKGLKRLDVIEEDRREKNPDRFTEKGFAAIGRLTELESLDLRGYRISESSLAKLRSLKKLRKLTICYSEVSSAAIEELQKGLPQCQVVLYDNWEPGAEAPPWFHKSK